MQKVAVSGTVKKVTGYSKTEVESFGIKEAIEEKLLEILGDQQEAQNAIISIMSSGESPYADGSQFGSDENMTAIRAHEVQRYAEFKPYLHLAVLKIENGTFGICENGGNHLISPERLKAVPWARTCIKCKNNPTIRTVQIQTAISMISKKMVAQ